MPANTNFDLLNDLSFKCKTMKSQRAYEMGLLVSDQVNAMLAYWDKNQVCRFANNAYMEWFGKSKEEMIDKITMKELLGPLYKKNLPHIQKALKGEKQVFEREIRLQNGSIRQTLATYIPDIVDNEVRGFFVHVADVSYIKELEALVHKSRRDMLRTVIETQEKERSDISDTLRDHINQTLVYCKLILEDKMNAKDGNETDLKLLKGIDHAIHELKNLSENLIPSSIKDFGFVTGVESFLESFKKPHPLEISFDCCDESIEELNINDKLSVFRIIQDYLFLASGKPSCKKIRIKVHYDGRMVTIEFSADDKRLELPRSVKEFMDISHRVEYYSGTMEFRYTGRENLLIINLKLN